MSQIIIICDTAEWFRLVLLLCMHFCIILYLLLMGTKICIRKYTFSQIEQILVVFSSGSNCSFLLFLFCFHNKFLVLDFYFKKKISAVIFIIILILLTLVLLLQQSFDPIITLHFSPSISTFSLFHVFWCCITSACNITFSIFFI